MQHASFNSAFQHPKLTMPASYLSKHRPICSVLEEIRSAALLREDAATVALCNEAISYAQRMSAKLAEYKSRDSNSHSK